MLVLGFGVTEVVQVHCNNKQMNVCLKDANGNEIILKMDSAQEWLDLLVDLEEKIRYAYAEQFELLYDEY